MADKEVFQAVIKAKDDTGATIAGVHERFKHLANEADHVSNRIEHMHKPHLFAEMGEHVNLVKENFGELRGSIGEVGSSITELLPAMAAFGAVGGLAGLFETVEHVAESYAELAHSATSLGMTTSQLQQLNIVATLTDTNVESMGKSMSKLNRVISDAASGHNKEAAATFHRVGINLRDSNGHLRSAIDILPQLADGFQHTADAANRTKAAFGFFGKQGADMLPMLMKGGAALKEKMGEAKHLGFDFDPYKEGLENYNESMKKLGVSTHAFTEEVGAKLAPILQPVVDHFIAWTGANRDWIATKIADHVGDLASWIESVDWKKFGDEVDHWAKRAKDFNDEVGIS